MHPLRLRGAAVQQSRNLCRNVIGSQFNWIGRKVRISRCRLNLRMSKQPANHRQSLA